MGLVISKGLTLRKGYIGTDDPDAEAYIAAVEAADEAASPGIGALETATKVAIHSFVKGAKADGFWPAIKASCILAGARTRLGALTPLVGSAPTSFNFVDGDYNRKTGLVGDGSTKYLDSNRNNNADPQNSQHMAVYASTLRTTGFVYIGTGDDTAGTTVFLQTGGGNNQFISRNRNSSSSSTGIIPSAGFLGMNRAVSGSYVERRSASNRTVFIISQTPFAGNVFVYGLNNGTGFAAGVDARLAFYSIGESLNLALLDARVTGLINAFGAAIP
jgi:hypothetical protein